MKKTRQTNIAVNDPFDTKYHTDHSLQCWYEVFFVHLPKCLFVITLIYLYSIHISQGSVETHLRCIGIYRLAQKTSQHLHALSSRVVEMNQHRSINVMTKHLGICAGIFASNTFVLAVIQTK